ncbi:hypothetical protein LPJ59_004026 [Coemansia sp. RSA 2399]|nr:hypothetical protein LPJ59_004026 [Coemansia sp. RSA 2399]
MSGSLETPWLSNTILTNVSKFGQTLNHGARRVQTFRINHNPDDKSFYKHTCELSDKFEFMRAALSPKALESQNVHDPSSLEHMIIQIRSFKLMFYSGAENTEKAHPRKKNGQKQRLSKISRSMCPVQIAKAGAPQIWLIVTDFTCLGGTENEIFGEPVHIKNNAEVARLMKNMLVEAKSKLQKGRDSPKTGSAQKRLAGGLLPADDSSGAESSKRRRQDSTDDGSVFPTIKKLPFFSDFDAMWSCKQMWQTLMVKHKSIPSMIIWNMEDDASDHGSEQQDEVECGSQEQQIGHQPDTSVAKASMMDHAIRINDTNEPTANKHQYQSSVLGQAPPKAAANGNGQKQQRSADSDNTPTLEPRQPSPDPLGRLLISDDAGLRSASDMLEEMYGAITIPEASDDFDVEMSDASRDAADGRYDASSVLQGSMSWNQDSGFSLY